MEGRLYRITTIHFIKKSPNFMGDFYFSSPAIFTDYVRWKAEITNARALEEGRPEGVVVGR